MTGERLETLDSRRQPERARSVAYASANHHQTAALDVEVVVFQDRLESGFAADVAQELRRDRSGCPDYNLGKSVRSANFDGCELDSGTVVEFCFAKMLDLPAVLLRTDFRVKGDNGKDPWNLMCSGYPRTEVLLISAMEQYHRLRQEFPQDTVKAMHRETAKMIVDALDRMFMVKSRFTPREACGAMKFAADTAGATVPELFPEKRIKELTEIKKQRQVY